MTDPTLVGKMGGWAVWLYKDEYRPIEISRSHREHTRPLAQLSPQDARDLGTLLHEAALIVEPAG